MSPELFLAFIGVTTILFLTPGPSMTLILANGAAHGVRAGIITVLGNAAGFAVLIVLVLAGLHLVVRHFENWFPVVCYAGAAYLFWLGISYFRKSLRYAQAGDQKPPASRGSHFLSGIVVAFANPTALFFLAALLPQFIEPGAERFLQSAVLATTFIAICILVQGGLAVAANQAARFVLRDNGRLMDQIAAVVLILGGLLLILARG
jgi:threonine/homoserine/homoserine lactone efflux protein